MEVVTSVLFYLPVGLLGLLGPACKEGVVEMRNMAIELNAIAATFIVQSIVNVL